MKEDLNKLDEMIDKIIQMEHDFIPNVVRDVHVKYLENCLKKSEDFNEN